MVSLLPPIASLWPVWPLSTDLAEPPAGLCFTGNSACLHPATWDQEKHTTCTQLPSATLSFSALLAWVSMVEEIPTDSVGTSLAWQSRDRYSASSTECRADRPGYAVLFIAWYVKEISLETNSGGLTTLIYHGRFIQSHLPLKTFLVSCLTSLSVYWFIDCVSCVFTTVCAFERLICALQDGLKREMKISIHECVPMWKKYRVYCHCWGSDVIKIPNGDNFGNFTYLTWRIFQFYFIGQLEGVQQTLPSLLWA